MPRECQPKRRRVLPKPRQHNAKLCEPGPPSRLPGSAQGRAALALGQSRGEGRVLGENGPGWSLGAEALPRIVASLVAVDAAVALAQDGSALRFAT